jgi:hypothetical protein
MIFAVDFDGTLCEENWPGIGKPNTGLINFLKREKETGAQLILWTMREGPALEEALDWCEGFGLIFDAVNDNLPSRVKEFNHNSRKVFADHYIDDHNAPYDFMTMFKIPFQKE